MRVIMVMFDSLNRHMLPPYGCEWVHAPNFERLAQRAATFEHSYVCSMPCMPARRDLHTGRPNFLHRSWGPIEPFDDSVPSMLHGAGIHTHLCTDHYHYFEEGGCNYHTRYSTWESFRGQEGDPWHGLVGAPVYPERATGQNALRDGWHAQDWKNRARLRHEEDAPQSQTFRAGIEFLHRNATEDNWFLQIETFDPHEPFVSPRAYKDLYRDRFPPYDGPMFDWPFYGPVRDTPEEVQHLVHENAALISMCDAKLGDVLDTMDALKMWDDTMLIVWTDHGFLLGEHEMLGKCCMPFYEEISHTPFFVWDPRSGVAGERRRALVQPAIDLGPTLLEAFGLAPTEHMTGRPLRDTVAHDTPVREAGLFGMHGAHVSVTDGRYVYMRAPGGDGNKPLYEYTLMPTHMRRTFATEELAGRTELTEGFPHMKGCSVLRIACEKAAVGTAGPENAGRHLLYDLQEDPKQTTPLQDAEVEARMIELLRKALQEVHAPPEQYTRLGL